MRDARVERVWGEESWEKNTGGGSGIMTGNLGETVYWCSSAHHEGSAHLEPFRVLG